MSPKRLPMLIALVVVAVVLVGAAYYAWAGHQRSDLKSSLSTGYATQSLTTPFTLTGKTWDAASQTWKYNYSAAVSAPDAVAAAKSQLAKGAYQVISGRPDDIAPNSAGATLYRDLITEDVALTIKITPNSATTSNVAVTLSAMHQ